MQDKTQFDSVASPTASLNAELDGEGEDEVLMYLDPMLTSLLKEVDPNAKPYVDEQGRVAVKLGYTRGRYSCDLSHEGRS